MADMVSLIAKDILRKKVIATIAEKEVHIKENKFLNTKHKGET